MLYIYIHTYSFAVTSVIKRVGSLASWLIIRLGCTGTGLLAELKGQMALIGLSGRKNFTFQVQPCICHTIQSTRVLYDGQRSLKAAESACTRWVGCGQEMKMHFYVLPALKTFIIITGQRSLNLWNKHR